VAEADVAGTRPGDPAVYEIAGAFFVLPALPVGLLCLVTGCTFGQWGGLT
jgi:uncharacterized membrane protein YdjX (TVP38/TMEM64 family)